MAHLIDTMAYTGQTPWHGLGNVLPPQQSLDIWLKAAGMDWTIEQSDVMFNVASDALHIRPYSDSKVLYRSDTLAPLSVAGREREHIVKLMPVQLTQHPVPFPDMGCSCPQIAASSASLPYGWFRLAACFAPCVVHRPIFEEHHLDISGRHPHSSRHPEPSAGYFQLPSALVPLRQTALVSVQPS